MIKLHSQPVIVQNKSALLCFVTLYYITSIIPIIFPNRQKLQEARGADSKYRYIMSHYKRSENWVVAWCSG